MLAVVLPGIWAAAGPGSIIYLAALKSIPDEMYEAADLDGAGIWTKIWRVTLPTLKPLILIINLLGATIGAFQASQNILVQTGGGPLYATHTLGLEIFYNAFLVPEVRLRDGGRLDHGGDAGRLHAVPTADDARPEVLGGEGVGIIRRRRASAGR